MTRTVISRVWTIFAYGLNSARKTLVEGKRWRFRDAFAELKEQLTLTRKAGVEGIKAIKLESSLYSAAVGQPSFVLGQYFVDNVTPKLGAFIAKQNLINAIGKIKNPNIRRMQLEEFDFGTRGPKLISARTYDLKDDNAMAIDVDIRWDSELVAKIKVTPKLLGINKRSSIVAVPVTVKNFRFEGVVRFVLTPLTDEPPGFGAALVSFPKAPNIGLDCTFSSVEITTAFPRLRTELLKEIQKAVANEFLWPKRIIVPSGIMPKPPKPVLSRTELEELSETDPLLKAEQRIDANEFIQKSNIVRDVADESELLKNMVVFVGDEAERNRLQNNTVSFDAKKGDGKGANRKRRGGGGGIVGLKLPWSNRRREEGTAT